MALARQSTLSKQAAQVFDQTIDELQTYVGPGKPVSSMNLEEFLHTFWDKGNQMHSSWDREHEFRMPADVCSPSSAREHSLHPSASLQSVPEDLRGMSVEEVWHHISERNSGSLSSGSPGGVGPPSSNLGRVTVSNFLQSVGMEVPSQHQDPQPSQRAGAAIPYGSIPPHLRVMPLPNPPELQVRVAPDPAGPSHAEGAHPGHPRLHHQSPRPSTPETPQRRKVQSPGLEMPGFDSASGNHEDKLVRQGGSLTAPDTPLVPSGEASPAAGRAPRNRKRKEIEIVDERSERLQKRMVKNRESAARSRQRKQQYTYDLEAQVENLKLQNRQLLEKVLDPERQPLAGRGGIHLPAQGQAVPMGYTGRASFLDPAALR